MKHITSDVAYLLIMGDLVDECRRKIDKKQEELTHKFGKIITLKVVDQERIGELYLEHMIGKGTV
ncbi:MAG: hypothetical protein FVQ80_18870 [Planctomycetes bacterium]|nr:hypothetical protein [Planctomycetota bacterium]